jgi:hypothetical protein
MFWLFWLFWLAGWACSSAKPGLGVTTNTTQPGQRGWWLE